MRRVAAGVIVIATGLVACSAAPPSGEAGERSDNAGGSASGGTSGSGAGGSGPSIGTGGGGPGSGGSAGEAPKECAASAFEAEPVPVDLAIMLDKSGSMAQPAATGGTLWGAVTNALQSFFTSPKSAGLGVSLQFFPLAGSCNVAGYASPAVPMSVLPGAAPQLSSALGGHWPDGLTPTGPALSGAIAYATSWAGSNPGHKVAVVLATDGLPTQCSPQDIGSIAQIAAGAFNGTPSIPTFVIGVGGALGALNTIAIAGGTGQAYIVDTNASAGDQFLDALSKIQVQALGCEYAIPQGSGPVDYGQVNVEVTPSGGAPTTVPGAGTLANCGNAPGWYYDDPANPTKIILCPASCDALEGDANAKISIVLGCETVVKPPS